MSHEPHLAGQTLVVIGGTSGIGLATARSAREQGAEVIITARDPDRLQRVGLELGAGTAAFDATDFDRLARFFDELSGPIDHVLVTGPVRTTRRCRSSMSKRRGATSNPTCCCR